MSHDPHDDPLVHSPQPEDESVVDFVRWWHWLLLAVVFLAGFVYFPKWQFEQRWNQLQIGDSWEQAKELLGDSGPASYSVRGSGPTSDSEVYVYTRYGRSYEVFVSTSSQRVTAKNVLPRK